mgnify:CR=1 FL=1
MDATITGAKEVALSLKQEGVEAVFGLAEVHIARGIPTSVENKDGG